MHHNLRNQGDPKLKAEFSLIQALPAQQLQAVTALQTSLQTRTLHRLRHLWLIMGSDTLSRSSHGGVSDEGPLVSPDGLTPLLRALSQQQIPPA